MKIIWILCVALIAGVIGGIVGAQYTPEKTPVASVSPTKEELIKEFYDIENAVYVSPHGMRTKMSKGIRDFILVDLRSAQEYDEEHIAGAINIPAYSDPDTSAYGDVERIVGAFKALPKDKEVIVYCYSIPCMTGRKIGKMLADNGVYVKHLGIGWNEWRYHWTLWNHAHEWNQTNVMDFIATGPEPGTPKLGNVTGACSAAGDFGC